MDISWVDLIRRVESLIGNIRINDIVDIIIVSFILYKVFQTIRETRAELLVRGIALIVGITVVSSWAELYALNWLLKQAMTLGTIAILIVFQPELRRALEKLGRTKIISRSSSRDGFEEELVNQIVVELVNACLDMSRDRTGALIVLERNDNLTEYIETGTFLDAKISDRLLVNIFSINTPLHDGAVVISGDRIVAAGCILPLSDDLEVSKELGTRHRAAIGVSELTDALVLVVSEETGAISYAKNGRLTRHIGRETLTRELSKLYDTEEKTSLLNRIRRTLDGKEKQ